MDEASRCDRLLLMREGGVLADDTLDGLLASTGTTEIEAAFLALVDRARAADREPDPEPGRGREQAGAKNPEGASK